MHVSGKSWKMMKFFLVILIDYLVHMNKCCESNLFDFFDECLWYDKDVTILDHESSPHASSFSLMDIHFYVNYAGIDKLVFNPFKADSCWSGTKSSIVKSFKILFCTFVYLFDFLLPCLDKYWLYKVYLYPMKLTAHFLR